MQRFQLRLSAVEDRIIMSVEDDAHVRKEFALTRRLVKRLWPGLGELAREARGLVPDPPDEPVLAAPAGRIAPAGAAPDGMAADDIAPEDPAAAGRAGTAAPAPADAGADDPDRPGAEPAGERHLVRRVRIVSKGPESKTLILSDGLTALNVPLNPRQLLDMVNALKAIVARAEWAFDTDFDWEDDEDAGKAAPAAIDITADSPSRMKH